jgi:hypothetical protein
MAHVPFRKRSQLGSSAAHRDTEGVKLRSALRLRCDAHHKKALFTVWLPRTGWFHSGSKSRLGGFGMNGVPTDGTSGAS